MKTQRERDAEKRAEKLKEIDDAVATGRLVIRDMTDEEREKNPPRKDSETQRSRRR
jgi:hypothetical protein